MNWFTIRNYGFSDATEIFIFISGYTAAFVYGRAMRERGILIASARVLRRAWQIYVAHIFLFTIFMAEIAYVAATFENPLYAEEMNILDFLKQPDVTIFQALILKFKPVNMDVLPLYIMLLLFFPPMLWLLIRQPAFALAGSALVYVLAWNLNWNLPVTPVKRYWLRANARHAEVVRAIVVSRLGMRIWPDGQSKLLSHRFYGRVKGRAFSAGNFDLLRFAKWRHVVEIEIQGDLRGGDRWMFAKIFGP